MTYSQVVFILSIAINGAKHVKTVNVQKEKFLRMMRKNNNGVKEL